MSFQAYLEAVEAKTGLSPRELISIAQSKGLDASGVKAGEILAWSAADYALGRRHGMAMLHVIQKGPQISEKHVGTDHCGALVSGRAGQAIRFRLRMRRYRC